MSGSGGSRDSGPDEHRAEAAAFELANALIDCTGIESMLGLLCERARSLLDVSAAGVFRAAAGSTGLDLIAASASSSSFLEVLARQAAHDGPALTCQATGFVVTAPDLSGTAEGRDADVDDAATRAAGVAGISAYPIEQDTTRLGVLCTLSDRPGILDPGTLRVGGLLGGIAAAALIFGPDDTDRPGQVSDVAQAHPGKPR